MFRMILMIYKVDSVSCFVAEDWFLFGGNEAGYSVYFDSIRSLMKRLVPVVGIA